MTIPRVFTVLVPPLLLTALMVRVLTLPGASYALKIGFFPDWHKLMDIHVCRMGQYIIGNGSDKYV